MSQATFELGPPEPVTDSRELPVITQDDESSFVTGADLDQLHPDNQPLPDDFMNEADVPPDDPPEQLPSEDDLDPLVASVDTDDIDAGFDPQDLGFVLDTGVVLPEGPPAPIDPEQVRDA
jgi:hypothetical protein